MRILVVGDINVDVILSGYESFPSPGREVLVDDYSMTLGCAACITAAGLLKLGNEVHFVGKAGCDPTGDFCLGEMSKLGLDVSRVVRDPAVRTGYTVAISSPEDRAHVSFLGATTDLSEEDVREEYFEGMDHLHLSSYFLLHRLRPSLGKLFKGAQAHGLSVSMDPQYDPAEEWQLDRREVLPQVDVFLPSEVEVRGITGSEDPLDGLECLENGRTLNVLKLGALGAVALADGECVHQLPPNVEPKDPTGAGDSFNAGFIHAWRQGSSLRDALKLGVSCGSYATLGLGGTTHQANLEQAGTMLKDYPPRTLRGSLANELMLRNSV
jgi:sugar/nucleoside kinase (ribokinase family)